MKTEQFVEIPADSLAKAVATAYDYSRPIGMGYLHFREGPLNSDEIADILARRSSDKRVAIHMDYVHGRCCKFIVFRDDGKYYVYPDWMDHTEVDLLCLLEEIGVENPIGKIKAAHRARREASEDDT